MTIIQDWKRIIGLKNGNKPYRFYQFSKLTFIISLSFKNRKFAD